VAGRTCLSRVTKRRCSGKLRVVSGAKDWPGDIVAVFARALVLAEAAGATEIGVQHLLAAAESFSDAGAELPGDMFKPVPRRDMPFSGAARKALGSLGDYGQSSVTDLLRVLRAGDGESSA
jgi:hypothetical protein